MAVPATKRRTHRIHIVRNTPVKQSARQKLELSQLRLDQRELMGHDVDVNSFYLQLQGVLGIDVIGAVLDATVDRGIDGASTLTVQFLDRDRKLLRSGKLSSKQDVQVDGLWFRLVSVDKQTNNIQLTFEDREIAIMRTYAQPIKATAETSRGKVTRAQFALRMLREIEEFKPGGIPYVIPELTVKQPVEQQNDLPGINVQQQQRNLGVVKGADLMVKTERMNDTQRQNVNIILGVAASRQSNRDIMVAAIMCATQESSITNLGQPVPGAYNFLSTDPNHNPVGVFQQIKAFGWPASRDVAKDASAFLDKFIPLYSAAPNTPLHQLIEEVQHSGHPEAYAQWHTQADRTVEAYGLTNGLSGIAANGMRDFAAGVGADYEFYRGIPPTQNGQPWLPEDTWSCLQRLANEVNWRSFMVSGHYYFISEEELFSSQPRARITEGVSGVDNIDGNYDEAAKVATATVTCWIGRWAAPPGSIIELYDMGPWDGRFIVSRVSRSLFESQGTIELEKPRPKLPEPISNNVGSGTGQFQMPGGNPGGVATPTYTGPQFGGVIPKSQQGSRKAIVEVAQRALAVEKTWHYNYAHPARAGGRPYPSSLWSKAAHGVLANNTGIDCSSFVTLVYKEAGCPDPNGPSYNYNGQGYTGTIASHGTYTDNPQPGDICMWGGSRAVPDHTGIYIGGGQCIEIGGETGIHQLPVSYRNDLVGYVNTLGDASGLPATGGSIVH